MKNSLLARQIRKLNLKKDSTPTNLDDWKMLLEIIESTYDEYESQRVFHENLNSVFTREMSQLYAEIEKKEAVLSDLVEAVPLFIAWVSYDAKIIGMNSEFTSLLGKTKDQLMDQTLGAVGLDEIHSHILDLKMGDSDRKTLSLTVKISGNTRYYRVLMNTFANENMIAVIGLDVTDEVENQKELDIARLKSVSSAKMAVLGEMAAGIAHEINNPLTIIWGTASQIIRDLKEKKYETIEARNVKIQNMVTRITKIVAGLRTFSRDGEHDPFSFSNVSSIINDTLELCREKLMKYDIALKVNEFDKNLLIECRATQISQVFLNLVHNSQDAIADLSEKWITVDVVDLQDRIKLILTDSGAGIPKEIQDKIFNPFFTTKEVNTGTGLGLSISIGIVQNHSGKIYLDTESKHTRFVIELPKTQK